ncbi:PPIL4, partial [Symbiodinium sp. CCMP2456]
GVLRLLEHDESHSLEDFLQRQQLRAEELANASVSRVLELVSQKAFWDRLQPLLREVGLIPEVDPQTQIRVEAERARVQEQLRIDAGVAEKVERIRNQQWVMVYEAIAADFDRALP